MSRRQRPAAFCWMHHPKTGQQAKIPAVRVEKKKAKGWLEGKLPEGWTKPTSTDTTDATSDGDQGDAAGTDTTSSSKSGPKAGKTRS